MSETADKITSDKSILAEAEFNPVKTWIEYANRLVGVIIGFLIIILFYKSFPFRKDKPVLFWLSAATLIAVIIQGWFGSIVVSTNLTTWTITLHFFLALLLVGFLVYLLNQSEGPANIQSPGLSLWLLLGAMLTLLVQVFLGTEVRSAIDVLAAKLPRESWVGELGGEFFTHRSFSWLVLILNGIFFWQTRKTIGLKALSLALFVLILSSLMTGVVLGYFDVPAAMQPVHLLLATVAFGLQLSLFFRMTDKRKISQ